MTPLVAKGADPFHPIKSLHGIPPTLVSMTFIRCNDLRRQRLEPPLHRRARELGFELKKIEPGVMPMVE